MKSRMPSTQKSKGTHNYPTPDQRVAQQELTAKHSTLKQAAALRDANPQGWQGWTLDGIAKTVNHFTLDEDGFAWA